MAKSYRALGKREEAAKYERLFEDIKAAFNKRYVAADGRIQGNTQCGYALALQFDLLLPELRQKRPDTSKTTSRPRAGTFPPALSA